MSKLFDKILIANRGEIACRVIRTCKRLGIKTVAVYSEADADALHVRQADEAVFIGPPPATQSYLLIDKIVEACKKTGAQAVHPGYGFLSEKQEFQKALAEAGITFIGPDAHAIYAMGDKIESKKLAPGRGRQHRAGPSRGDPQCRRGGEDRPEGRLSGDDQGLGRRRRQGHAHRLQRRRGPAKASSRRPTRPRRRSPTTACSSRSTSRSRATSRSSCIADGHGNCVYLWERECSIQRRHQKVIEEAPSPFLDAKTRKAMGEQAVALAKAVKYKSAGTVEFIVDKNRKFYFLEMNTRLQVEHPVTELITGLDLVELMIRVAAGEKLPFAQKDVKLDGWAVEARRLCRGSVPQLPAVDRPAGEVPRARARPGRARRYRRVRGRRDLDVLRSDDRQALHLREDAARRDRPHAPRARRVLCPRRVAQRAVPRRADGPSALPRGPAHDQLHRRGVQGRLHRGAPAAARSGRAGRGRRASVERVRDERQRPRRWTDRDGDAEPRAGGAHRHRQGRRLHGRGRRPQHRDRHRLAAGRSAAARQGRRPRRSRCRSMPWARAGA